MWGCRLTVGGETKFACVDGPEFDAHQVDWDEAMKRLTQYREGGTRLPTAIHREAWRPAP